MIIFWAVALMIFLVAEGLTAGLISIWFAAGALVALACTILGADIWIQWLVFILISLLAMVLAKPLARRWIDASKVHTNADRVLDGIAVVIEDINNIDGVGAVKIDGKIWSARSRSGDPIPKDSQVRVQAIEGVKLIVE